MPWLKQYMERTMKILAVTNVWSLKLEGSNEIGHIILLSYETFFPDHCML